MLKNDLVHEREKSDKTYSTITPKPYAHINTMWMEHAKFLNDSLKTVRTVTHTSHVLKTSYDLSSQSEKSNKTIFDEPGRVAQSVGHLTPKSGVLGSIPGLATYFRFSFRFFKKDSCQLLAKVCA